MTEYYLRRDIFFCSVQGNILFVNLCRDSYQLLTTEYASKLIKRIPSFIGKDAQCDYGTLSEENDASYSAEQIVNTLIDQKILTTNAAEGNPIAQVNVEIPTRSIFEDQPIRSFIAPADIFRFLFASYRVMRNLKNQSLDLVIHQMRARKAKKRAFAATYNFDEAHRLTHAFKRMLPFLKTREDECLFEGLALTEFLSYYGIFPTCVIGVVTDEFGAHCWVQDRGCVFNDTVERVLDFTPIVSI